MPTECVIGVDLGGTTLRAGVVDSDLAVVAQTRRTVAGLDLPTLLETVADAVNELCGALAGGVEAVGFGIACLVDDERGVAASSIHLPIASLAFADTMAERLGLPVFVDNDANLALLAEYRHGAARGERFALMLTLGTGVGGAIMSAGELYHGAQGAAGEFGHMIVDPDGPECGPGCPSRGCLEAWTSGTALAREAVAAAGRDPGGGLGRALAAGRAIDGPAVTALALEGDESALGVLSTLGEWLGVGLVSMVNIFNPDVVVVGGGVSGAGELILGPARRVLMRRGLAVPARHAEIRAARFGAQAGMFGAALLARESLERRVAA